MAKTYSDVKAHLSICIVVWAKTVARSLRFGGMKDSSSTDLSEIVYHTSERVVKSNRTMCNTLFT